MQFVLLNSFDRSGSTMLCNVLSKHPNIETLFNPFNSSIFRETFMDYWDISNKDEDQLKGTYLVDKVFEGNFSREHIKSGVFFQNSSSIKLSENSIHVIKTTNFHMKLNWFKMNYPATPVFALIRNPLGILSSLVRNGFHTAWYGNWAYKNLIKFIERSDKFSTQVKYQLTNYVEEIEQMAVVIGILNSEMLNCVHENNIIRYEDIIWDTNSILNEFVRRFNLKAFDFKAFVSKSTNSSGKPFEGIDKFKDIFTIQQIENYKRIFRLCGDQGYTSELT